MRPRACAMYFEAFIMHLSWYMMSLGHLCRIWTLLHTSLMFANLWHRLSMWDTSALWVQCLRILFDLWVFDLEVSLVTFTILTLCWHLVIVVSELLLRYCCIWLSFSREVEQNILLSMLVWNSGMLSLCEELIWGWNMRFQWCSVLHESFVKELEWIISF